MARKPDDGEGPTHWRRVAAMLERHAVGLVLDIGAHRGEYAGYLRRAGWTGRIVSLEPQAEVWPELVAAAEADPAWQVAPRAAVGGAPGDALLRISAETDMSSLLPFEAGFLESSPSSETVREERVPLTTLPALLADHAGPGERVFVKLDTQGSEEAILDGLGLPVPGNIAGFQLELSLIPLYEGETVWRPLVDRLAAAGFDLHFVIPGYWSRHLGRMVQFDGIFFRES